MTSSLFGSKTDNQIPIDGTFRNTDSSNFRHTMYIEGLTDNTSVYKGKENYMPIWNLEYAMERELNKTRSIGMTESKTIVSPVSFSTNTSKVLPLFMKKFGGRVTIDKIEIEQMMVNNESMDEVISTHKFSTCEIVFIKPSFQHHRMLIGFDYEEINVDYSGYETNGDLEGATSVTYNHVKGTVDE